MTAGAGWTHSNLTTTFGIDSKAKGVPRRSENEDFDERGIRAGRGESGSEMTFRFSAADRKNRPDPPAAPRRYFPFRPSPKRRLERSCPERRSGKIPALASRTSEVETKARG